MVPGGGRAVRRGPRLPAHVCPSPDACRRRTSTAWPPTCPRAPRPSSWTPSRTSTSCCSWSPMTSCLCRCGRLGSSSQGRAFRAAGPGPAAGPVGLESRALPRSVCPGAACPLVAQLRRLLESRGRGGHSAPCPSGQTAGRALSEELGSPSLCLPALPPPALTLLPRPGPGGWPVPRPGRTAAHWHFPDPLLERRGRGLEMAAAACMARGSGSSREAPRRGCARGLLLWAPFLPETTALLRGDRVGRKGPPLRLLFWARWPGAVLVSCWACLVSVFCPQTSQAHQAHWLCLHVKPRAVHLQPRAWRLPVQSGRGWKLRASSLVTGGCFAVTC